MTLSIIEFPDLRKKSSGERLCFYASAENSTGFDEKVDIQRVAARMKKDVGDYRQFYIKFIDMNLGGRAGNSGLKIIKEAVDSVEMLPKTIENTEAVHSALKKVGAAARVIISLQELEIERLRKENISLRDENERLRRPRAVVRSSSNTASIKTGVHKLVLTLLDLKERGVLPAYVPGRGRNSPNPDVWIEARLSENGISEKQIELAKNDPSVWYQVDRRLYSIKVTRHLREKSGTSLVQSNKLRGLVRSTVGGGGGDKVLKIDKKNRLSDSYEITRDELVDA